MNDEPDCEKDIETIRKCAAEGRIKMSPQGEKYFARAGGISRTPDFGIVDVVIESVWGPWHHSNPAGEDTGNEGGITIGWQSVSAGWGSLTIYKDRYGTIQAQTEMMGREFCKSVLMKLAETMVIEGEPNEASDSKQSTEPHAGDGFGSNVEIDIADGERNTPYSDS